MFKRNQSGTTAQAVIVCALACFFLVSGCRSVQIPRIDPTGERIFLPAPNYTTLESPVAHGNGLSCLPAPAYQTPPTPPPCPVPAGPAIAAPGAVLGPPPCATPLAPQAISPQTRLILNGTKFVAPIQDQVTLIAGVCGPNNRYLGGEQIEWFLSKDSAGHFLELEGEHIGGIGRVLHPLPKKVSADYAVGKTTVNKGRLITCGKKNNEKIWLREGQTWITLTSATEGVSRVTAFSPDGESSPARQETAEIYWVDVAYTFPTVAPTRAGDEAILTTVVQRHSNGNPLAGWIVRYEFAGGNAIGFAPQGAQAVDVTTDQNGVASVGVAQREVIPGASDIRVTIMRPAAKEGEADRLPIASRPVTIPWSAPGLTVRTVGPAGVSLGHRADYQIEVENPGDLATDGVVAQMQIPLGMQWIAANPQPRQVGDRLEWDLGRLESRERRTLQVQLRGDQQGEYQICSSARAATGELADQHCITTGVYRPAVRVEMGGPQTAEVGETIQFQVRIINDGQLPLRNVVLIDRYDPGLSFPGGGGALERLIGDIAPGGEERIGVDLEVVAPGQHGNRVEVTTEGGHTASAQMTVNAVQPQQTPQPNPLPGSQDQGPSQPGPIQPQGQVDVSASGPPLIRVGETAKYAVIVTNNSNATLNNLQVVYTYAPTMTATAGTGGFQTNRAANQVSWSIAQLGPGQFTKQELECKGLREDNAGGVSVLVVADNLRAVRREAATQIAAAPAGPAGPTPTPAIPRDTGSLQLKIAPTRNPVPRLAELVYSINLTNERNVSDRDVLLSFRLPDGLSLQSINLIQGTTSRRLEARRGGPDDRTYTIPAITEMRAGEAMSFQAVVTPLTLGPKTVTAFVESRRSPNPVRAVADVNVVGQ